jgi:hypothetical protein
VFIVPQVHVRQIRTTLRRHVLRTLTGIGQTAASARGYSAPLTTPSLALPWRMRSPLPGSSGLPLSGSSALISNLGQSFLARVTLHDAGWLLHRWILPAHEVPHRPPPWFWSCDNLPEKIPYYRLNQYTLVIRQ